MGSRGWAVVVLGGLLVVLGVILAVSVPWSAPPAPHADQVAALRDTDPGVLARGRAFRADLRPGSYGALLVGLLLAVLLGLTPLGARLVELVGRPFGGHWLARAVLGGLVLVFAGELATLPFAAWRHSISVRYGLSTQSWGAWTVDVLKAFAITAVLGAVVLAGFYTLTHLAPRWWWTWAAAGAAGLVVLFSFVFPVLVEPVFNKFTPMADQTLRAELLAMAERDGVPVKEVLVADASRRTRAVNAYVSGIGPTRRIVVYDTLLAEAPPAEVKLVVAHELGHAKRGDVTFGTALGALGAAAGVIALYLLGSWTGLLRRAGVTDIGDPRAIGLVLLVATVAGLLFLPAQNLVSRRIEARADLHALELTGDPATAESLERRLAERNLADLDPNPVEHFLFGSHPSTVERIAIARAYGRGRR